MAGLLGGLDPLAGLLGPAQNTDPLAAYLGVDPAKARMSTIADVAGGLSDALLYRGPRKNSGGIAGAIGQLGSGLAAGGTAAVKGQQERLATDLLKKQALTKMQDEDYARQREKEQDAAWTNFAASLPEDQRKMVQNNPALAQELGKQWAQAQYAPASDTPALIQEYEYAKQGGFKGTLLDYQQAKLKQTTERTPASIQEYEYAKKGGYKGSFEEYKLAMKGAGITIEHSDGSKTTIGGSGAGGKSTEAQRRAEMIGKSMVPSVENLNTTFNSLADPANSYGQQMSSVGGRWFMTEEGQQAYDSIYNIIYANKYIQSGQTVTPVEVRQGVNEVLPFPSDKPGTKKLKWERLQAIVKSINEAGTTGAETKQVTPKEGDPNAPEPAFPPDDPFGIRRPK